MHIGFDISQTGASKAGCGYLSHAEIKAMLATAPQHRYSLYPSFGGFFFDGAMPASNPYRGEKVSYGPRHLTREIAGEFWNQPGLEAALDRPDIIHSNNFWMPVQPTSSRIVYTLYDLGFASNPEWTTESNRVGCFEGVFRASVAADWVVAISENSRAHYLRLFPHFPAERIRVVSPCSRFDDPTLPGTRPAAGKDLVPGEFWLSVGTIEPRKNQRMLAEAYAGYLEGGGRPMPLVLAGGKGWLMETFQEHLAKLGISDRVILTGYVSDQELIWLYRNCCASLYPSLFEGFGLPVLEGMQFGAATMCSNTTSMPEVAGDAAILLSPHDTAAWTRNMLELASNEALRQGLSRAARERAKQFDWKDSAAALLDIYEEAIRSPKRAEMNQTASAANGPARLENVG
jgi:glycosyltransferase involved in cell wall biosynthesis